MKTVTVNVSDELFDTLSLLAAHQDVSVSELLTKKLDLAFECQNLLDKMLFNSKPCQNEFVVKNFNLWIVR